MSFYSDFRVAIIYNEANLEAQLVLEDMLSHDICPVGLISQKKIPYSRNYISLFFNPVRVLKGLLNRMRNILCPTNSPQEEIKISEMARKHNLTIHYVENINSKETASLLREIVKPNLLILAGAPIIRQHILDIPTIGTLNAHPGYLPLFRGMDVVRWTIIEKGPLAVTLHFVDDGVDTGPILVREPIPFYLGDNIDILRKRATYIAAKLIVKGLKMISRDKYETIPQTRAEGRQYYRVSKEQAEEAEIELQKRIEKEMNPKFDLE